MPYFSRYFSFWPFREDLLHYSLLGARQDWQEEVLLLASTIFRRVSFHLSSHSSNAGRAYSLRHFPDNTIAHFQSRMPAYYYRAVSRRDFSLDAYAAWLLASPPMKLFLALLGSADAASQAQRQGHIRRFAS
jgi:hypothetical protein